MALSSFPRKSNPAMNTILVCYKCINLNSSFFEYLFTPPLLSPSAFSSNSIKSLSIGSIISPAEKHLARQLVRIYACEICKQGCRQGGKAGAPSSFIGSKSPLKSIPTGASESRHLETYKGKFIAGNQMSSHCQVTLIFYTCQEGSIRGPVKYSKCREKDLKH